jgi:hypothetical protein
MKRKLQVIAMTIMTLFVISQANAQVPYGLNSHRSASATLFIDFDGQTVVSPYWNGGNPIFCAPTALTNAQMIRVFNQVSEDFRPFNINITTDSAVYFAAPATKRQRIIVTPTSSWYGSAGGVAYVESFRWGLEIPGFVFSTLLSNNDKRVAEATSHESGHTLGLYHQSQYNSTCGFVNEYNPGIGTTSSEISWAPIMGNSYSRNLTLWHNGPNSFGCNNLQDDLSVLSGAANGFGFRADDVANTTAGASNISFSGNDYAISGFVNSTNDVDMFKLQLTSAGRFTLNGLPYSVAPTNNTSANIDLQVSLLNQSGTTIATFNPTTSVRAIIDSTLAAGTYYVRVSNTSNIYASNYGMLGNYAMTGTFTANSTLPIYSLVLTGNNNKGKHELNWTIVADEALENITIETSADGHNFTKIQDVEGSSRNFSYQPVAGGNRFYRLHVVTASQLEYFSNIVSVRAAANTSKVKILNNNITGNDILVQSQGNYNFRLIDMGGRQLTGGKMNTGFNRISTPSLQSGVYLLQVMDGTEITTERLMVR